MLNCVMSPPPRDCQQFAYFFLFGFPFYGTWIWECLSIFSPHLGDGATSNLLLVRPVLIYTHTHISFSHPLFPIVVFPEYYVVLATHFLFLISSEINRYVYLILYVILMCLFLYLSHILSLPDNCFLWLWYSLAYSMRKMMADKALVCNDGVFDACAYISFLVRAYACCVKVNIFV